MFAAFIVTESRVSRSLTAGGRDQAAQNNRRERAVPVEFVKNSTAATFPFPLGGIKSGLFAVHDGIYTRA